MPELYDDVIIYWQAFQELDQNRTVGFNVNPIAISEIDAWLRIHGVDEGNEKIEYFQLIKALDRVYLNWNKEKQEEKANERKEKTNANTVSSN